VTDVLSPHCLSSIVLTSNDWNFVQVSHSYAINLLNITSHFLLFFLRASDTDSVVSVDVQDSEFRGSDYAE